MPYCWVDSASDFLYQYNMTNPFYLLSDYQYIMNSRKGAIISPFCPCFLKSVSFVCPFVLFDSRTHHATPCVRNGCRRILHIPRSRFLGTPHTYSPILQLRRADKGEIFCYRFEFVVPECLHRKSLTSLLINDIVFSYLFLFAGFHEKNCYLFNLHDYDTKLMLSLRPCSSPLPPRSAHHCT